MTTILWACWDGGGNLTPSLGIARALRARGHEVVFVGRGQMFPRVEAEGFATRELTQAYTLIDRYEPHPQIAVFGFLSSPAAGEELAGVVAREMPDVVVVDWMFGAALDMVPRFGVPAVGMVHTFIRRCAGMLKGNLPMQSELRRHAGLPPLPPPDELLGRLDLIHSNSLEAFDSPGPDPWPNVGHGAPVLAEEGRAAAPALPWADDDPTPLVLLSFSTVLVQRAPAMLQRALDAMAPLPVHIVATTGGIVDVHELASPENAVVLPFASHDALMERAALVVGHGGHGTSMRALHHGVPMVLTPAGGGDQPIICALVEDWGVGRRLDRDPDGATLSAAVEAVLAEPSYRAKARAMGAALHGRDGAELAANALEGISASTARRPASASVPDLRARRRL